MQRCGIAMRWCRDDSSRSARSTGSWQGWQELLARGVGRVLAEPGWMLVGAAGAAGEGLLVSETRCTWREARLVLVSETRLSAWVSATPGRRSRTDCLGPNERDMPWACSQIHPNGFGRRHACHPDSSSCHELRYHDITTIDNVDDRWPAI